MQSKINRKYKITGLTCSSCKTSVENSLNLLDQVISSNADVRLGELTLSLKIVLWVEVIVYLGLGIFEIFDDFFRKIPHWTIFKGKLNSYLFMADKMQHKFHAAICFFLGFIALNGLVEGAVTRFEIELLFVGLSLIMMLLCKSFTRWAIQ